jgi:biopolymer transport protein ExbD
MAEKRRFLDVWIVETNTVYREVPYTVVADWVQQGRLLENDQLRPSGTNEWFLLGSMPAFAAYLPKEEPFRAEDQAEALEPVQIDFAWKQRRGEEDDDPDMIPLIDVSLVLLIFFMMISTVGAAVSPIHPPKAEEGAGLSADQTVLWVGVQMTPNGQPIYSLGEGTRAAQPEDQNLSLQTVIDRLKDRLAAERGHDVRVDGEPSVPYEHIKRLVAALEGLRARRLINKIHAGVS